MNKIVIDGNISSGKSTQLNLLENSGYTVRREPIDDWPLELYYSDEERWGLVFQMIVLQTLKTQEGQCIYERCHHSSMNIFWPLMKKHEIEDRVYRTAFEKSGWGPDVYIFIDKNPELCYEHISKRNQSGDTSVSLDYLKRLDKQYQKMFSELGCLKFRVDGNLPIEKVHEEILKILNQIYLVNG